MQLVTVQGNKVFCDSSMVAKKFGVKHAYVIRNCDALISDINEIKGDSESPLIIKEEREYRGTNFTAYIMDRSFFSLLCMRFKGKEAIRWQMQFNSAFYAMEKVLSETPKTMDSLNEIVKRIESEKGNASIAGKALSQYKKIKKDQSNEFKLAVDQAQLSLGFEKLKA